MWQFIEEVYIVPITLEICQVVDAYSQYQLQSIVYDPDFKSVFVS